MDKVAAMIKSKHQSTIRLHNGGLAINLTEEVSLSVCVCAVCFRNEHGWCQALGRLADRCVELNIFNEEPQTSEQTPRE